MADGLVIYRSAERPDLRLWLLDDTGALINFATGYSFTLKLGRPGSTATFTKTASITGAAGTGTAPSGTPNVTIAFTADETDSLVLGSTTWQLIARTGTSDRVFEGRLTVKDVIT